MEQTRDPRETTNGTTSSEGIQSDNTCVQPSLFLAIDDCTIGWATRLVPNVPTPTCRVRSDTLSR